MRILRLELSDVRQFHHQFLEFGPGFNLLVGENGAGKSTVLRSLLSALGNAENFKLSDRLSDEDIRQHAQAFHVRVEFQSSGTVDNVEIKRRWRGSTKRSGRVPETPVIWFGANEAIPASLRGHKVRRYRSNGDDEFRRKDDFLEREDFLYREEFMDPSDEREQTEFGRSEMHNGRSSLVARYFMPFSDMILLGLN